jgi:DNA-binding SARP family transcriptional activator
LLVGRGDPDEAERVARRAIAADPWAEAAFGVLVSVALARGDRSAARLALDRCLAALADIAVEPSEDTRRLRRRVRNA